MDLDVIPDLNEYSAFKTRYKLFGHLYDMVVIILSILDTVTTILVFHEFFTLQHSSQVVDVLFVILFIWLGCVQILYIISFNARFNDCTNDCYVMCSVVTAPLIPMIYYVCNSERTGIFTTSSKHPLLHQFGTTLRNKHAGFMIQSVGESIPSAIVQTLILIYQSNNHSENYYNDQLQFWLCISITTTFVTVIVKMFLVIDYTYVTNKWLVFNYLCIICDILSFFTAVIWIFYDNDSLFSSNRSDDDESTLSGILVTFFSNVNHNAPEYEAAWIYSVIIGILPTLFTVIIVGMFGAGIDALSRIFDFCCTNCCNCLFSVCILIGAPFVAALVGMVCIFCLLIIAILFQLSCWIGIGLWLLDLNKLMYVTKYDSILWNHFLCESKIMKTNKKLAIIAINYSLLRKGGRRHGHGKHLLATSRASVLLKRLTTYIKKKANSEVNMINNRRRNIKDKQEQFKNKLNRKVKAITSINRSDSISHRMNHSMSMSINAQSRNNNYSSYNSLNSTLIDAEEDEIKHNEQNYRKQLKLIYAQPMKDVTFAKLRQVRLYPKIWHDNYIGITKLITDELLFAIKVMSECDGCLVLLFRIWVEIVGFIPYVLSRLIVVSFPWILLFSDIIPKIANNENGIKGYYENEVINDDINMYKHLLLAGTLIICMVMILLLVSHIIPVLYYCYHILPGERKLPNINSKDIFDYVFMDIYACYDVLFVSRIREYYILNRFGDDIGMIVLKYLGIGKDSGLDIDTSIDSLNPKIVNKKIP